MATEAEELRELRHWYYTEADRLRDGLRANQRVARQKYVDELNRLRADFHNALDALRSEFETKVNEMRARYRKPGFPPPAPYKEPPMARIPGYPVPMPYEPPEIPRRF